MTTTAPSRRKNEGFFQLMARLMCSPRGNPGLLQGAFKLSMISVQQFTLVLAASFVLRPCRSRVVTFFCFGYEAKDFFFKVGQTNCRLSTLLC